VARSKTDQGAAGQIVGVVAGNPDLPPVAALRTWLEGRRHHRWRGVPQSSIVMA
jgi:hypothetical protein